MTSATVTSTLVGKDSAPADQADAELVRAAVAGDSGAARELVRIYHRPIFNYVVRMLGQVQDAEDVTQETFVKAFRSLHKVDTSRPLLNWLYTIARRSALNHIRARRNWVELPPESASDSPGPRREVESEESVSRVWSLARRILKPAEYEILWLRFGENLSVEETAQTTERSQSSIKTLLHRARRRLMAGNISLS
ncbi:MAG: sigma-70 family RNA polymerase sigma factor [Synoicihabitans sp.]